MTVCGFVMIQPLAPSLAAPSFQPQQPVTNEGTGTDRVLGPGDMCGMPPCESSYDYAADVHKAKQLIDTYAGKFFTTNHTSLHLPTTYGGVTIEWKSESPYVSNDGTIIKRPRVENGDATVTMVATFKKVSSDIVLGSYAVSVRIEANYDRCSRQKTSAVSGGYNDTPTNPIGNDLDYIPCPNSEGNL